MKENHENTWKGRSRGVRWAYIYMCMYIFIYIHICVYTYVYVCTCTCIYIKDDMHRHCQEFLLQRSECRLRRRHSYVWPDYLGHNQHAARTIMHTYTWLLTAYKSRHGRRIPHPSWSSMARVIDNTVMTSLEKVVHEERLAREPSTKEHASLSTCLR